MKGLFVIDEVKTTAVSPYCKRFTIRFFALASKQIMDETVKCDVGDWMTGVHCVIAVVLEVLQEDGEFSTFDGFSKSFEASPRFRKDKWHGNDQV